MKRNRRRKKKGGIKKVLFLLILIVIGGIGIGLLSLFRQELSRLVSPWLEKRGFLEGKREITLFFSDREAEYLVGEKRAINRGEDTEAAAGELIREIIRGPRGQLFPTLPSQARLLSFQIDESGVARINFSKAFLRDHPGGSSAEMMTVYSVVNSLTLNFPEIKRVQFLVEGREIETIAGHLSLRQPISPKSDLIRKSGVQVVK
jgi:spore germination protein GerM